MKILLLGANGQLGSDIVHMNRTASLLGLNRHDLDITDKKAVYDYLKPLTFDVLINCTSYTNTEEAELNASLAFDINAFAVKTLANICHEKKARLVQISSDYIFDDHPEKIPIKESHPPSPLNIYGASKLMGESLANASHDDVLIFRVASLFGIAGARAKKGNFVETMLRVAKEKGKCRVISDQIMSPTSTAHIAESILQAIELRIPAGVYHCVNTGQASWYTFAKEIISMAKINAEVLPVNAAEYPSSIRRPAFSALDNSKLTELIGPIPGWEEGLKEYFSLRN